MKTPVNLIKRNRYIEAMLPYVDKQIIKVITGQRRVGKSYLLFQMIQQIQESKANPHIIYINKEDLQFDFIHDANTLSDYVNEKLAKSGRSYLFIDEIQDIQDFHVALRSLLLNENLDIYCTGSNANLLSRDISGNLSGRFIEQMVYSLSYSEFLEFHGLENNSSALVKYMKYGGLPYLKHLSLEDEIVFEYLKNIYNTIVYRDIVNRYNIRNTNFLERLVLFLASNTGSIFSAKKISDFLKSQRLNVPPNQVQTYLSYLQNAFIVLPALRYNIQGKRLFEIGEKYYFENLGIRNALWGYRIEDRGKIIENMVHNHLCFLQYTVRVGVLGNQEIDFVAEKNGEIVYVQVALQLTEEKTIEREFGNLMKIQDNYPKMVVTLDPYSGNTVSGILVVHIADFLLREKLFEVN
jgi:predicted AAA+ superfamily ATPase